jgi:uncharacterized protein
MILPDVNLLIYAMNADAPRHGLARRWLESVLSGPDPVGFAWTVILAFLRLTTRPGLFAKPLSTVEALDLAAAWLEQPSAVIVHPGPDHLGILRRLLSASGTGGNLTSDAHLAALAMEHGAVLCSCDADFARFGGLQWRDPLTP